VGVEAASGVASGALEVEAASGCAAVEKTALGDVDAWKVDVGRALCWPEVPVVELMLSARASQRSSKSSCKNRADRHG
jgi:hypothetical protein